MGVLMNERRPQDSTLRVRVPEYKIFHGSGGPERGRVRVESSGSLDRAVRYHGRMELASFLVKEVWGTQLARNLCAFVARDTVARIKSGDWAISTAMVLDSVARGREAGNR